MSNKIPDFFPEDDFGTNKNIIRKKTTKWEQKENGQQNKKEKDGNGKDERIYPLEDIWDYLSIQLQNDKQIRPCVAHDRPAAQGRFFRFSVI